MTLQPDSRDSNPIGTGFFPEVTLSDRTASVLRAILFLYLAVIFCPIRYYAITGDLDNTWVFALNYAAANGLRMGRDIEFTAGPLAWLAIPQDIGSNLAAGLLFQAAVWVVLILILWQLFFRSGFSIVTLAIFSILQGFAAPLYRVNTLGIGPLLVTGALILLLRFRLRGGVAYYLIALGMLGLVPLIQFVGVPIVAGIVAGLAADSILEKRPGALRDIVLAAAVPLVVTGIGYGLTLRSVQGLAIYLRSSLEVSSGYNFAMSIAGIKLAPLAAFETLGVLAIALVLLGASDRRTARFLSLILWTRPYLLKLSSPTTWCPEWSSSSTR